MGVTYCVSIAGLAALACANGCSQSRPPGSPILSGPTSCAADERPNVRWDHVEGTPYTIQVEVRCSARPAFEEEVCLASSVRTIVCAYTDERGRARFTVDQLDDRDLPADSEWQPKTDLVVVVSGHATEVLAGDALLALRRFLEADDATPLGTARSERENARERALAADSQIVTSLDRQQADAEAARRAAVAEAALAAKNARLRGECQAFVDAGDAGAAIRCWEDSTEPAVDETLACFAVAKARRSAMSSCLAMPEHDEKQLIAKGVCVDAQPDLGPDVCGPFVMATYQRSVSTALSWPAEIRRIKTKAHQADRRERARRSACHGVRTISILRQAMDRERRVGQISGFVNATLLHQLGSQVEILERFQPRVRAGFKQSWGRPFDSRRDC